MSIADVSELVAEATRISGRSDLPTMAPMWLGFLEDRLNSDLRHRSMLASSTVTTNASGVGSLPSDYLETQTVTYGTDETHLVRLSPEMFDAGLEGYYIDGSNLVSSEAGTDHALTYYQAIPSLWTNGTNWILTARPAVYLRGLVMEAVADSENIERLGAVTELFNREVAGLERADRLARRIDTVALPRTQF